MPQDHSLHTPASDPVKGTADRSAALASRIESTAGSQGQRVKVLVESVPKAHRRLLDGALSVWTTKLFFRSDVYYTLPLVEDARM
jgi:hypothetical protein